MWIFRSRWARVRVAGAVVVGSCGAAALAIIAVRVAAQPAAPAAPAPTTGPATQAATADAGQASAAMQREAEAVLQLVRQQEEVGGERMTPDFLNFKYEWSRKLALAVWDSGADPQRKVRALEEHLERVRRAAATLKLRAGRGIDVSAVPAHAAAYYEAEAELWLARAKAGAGPAAAPGGGGR